MYYGQEGYKIGRDYGNGLGREGVEGDGHSWRVRDCRDKTKADKLMYVPNDDIHNYIPCRL